MYYDSDSDDELVEFDAPIFLDDSKYICLTKAKAKFKLTDKDLSALAAKVKYVENPYYPTRRPMKLYPKADVKALAEAKQKQKQWDEEHAEEIAEAKREAAKARKVQAAEAAHAAVKGFKPTDAGAQARPASTNLPLEVLSNILAKVAEPFEPAGIRTVGVVVADLANVALSCWDMAQAAGAAYESLAQQQQAQQQQQQQQSTMQLPEGVDWDKAVQNPTSFKVTELKSMAKLIKAHVSGTKAELILRILNHFGVSAPTSAPATLLFALKHDRSQTCNYHNVTHRVREISCCDPTDTLVAQAAALFSARKPLEGRRLLAQRFATMEDLAAHALEAVKAQNQRRMEQQLQRRQMQMERQAAAAAAGAVWRVPAGAVQPQHGPVPGQNPLVCACGNAAAKACTWGMCAHCCKGSQRGGCVRHNT